MYLKSTERDKNSDIFFETSDPKVIVIMHALHKMNSHIPHDIGVLGFDNVECRLLLSRSCQRSPSHFMISVQ